MYSRSTSASPSWTASRWFPHEVVSVINLPHRDDPASVANVIVRGLSQVGIRMRDGAELVEGRWFEPGKREMVVGSGVHTMRDGTSVGDTLYFGRDDWNVVGVFTAGRSPFNSEIWGRCQPCRGGPRPGRQSQQRPGASGR